ncbi:MAG: hypothetical protein AAF170_17720 [Bacteroidota bacterium]
MLVASNAIQRQATAWAQGRDTVVEDASVPEDSASAETPMDRVNATMRIILEIWLRYFFVTTPLIGFYFYVFFRGRRPTYPPHFVLGLELASFGVLTLLTARWLRIVWVLVPPHATLRETWPQVTPVLLAAVILATTAMATLAIRRFYGVSTWKAIAASPLLLLAPFTVLVGVAFAVTFGILVFAS